MTQGEYDWMLSVCLCVCTPVWRGGAESAAVLVHLLAWSEDSRQGSTSSGTRAGSGKGPRRSPTLHWPYNCSLQVQKQLFLIIKKIEKFPLSFGTSLHWRSLLYTAAFYLAEQSICFKSSAIFFPQGGFGANQISWIGANKYTDPAHLPLQPPLPIYPSTFWLQCWNWPNRLLHCHLHPVQAAEDWGCGWHPENDLPAPSGQVRYSSA